MFSLLKPSQPSILRKLETARELPTSYGPPLNTQSGLDGLRVPRGFVRDHTRSEIGRGPAAFKTAQSAFRRWEHFNLGWVRIANPEAPIEPGEIIAMESHTLGLWTVNFSRILYTIDEPHRFGYGYGTTARHVERGEERFLLEFDPTSGAVTYELLAASQPAHWMTWLGYPYARSRQHKFARESHRHMRQIVADSV
jgi:uncharacterized protein (UPF0548 family)